MAKRLTVSVQQPQRRLIGYARVSTDGQIHDAQIDELRAAGCGRIYQEHGSGASRAQFWSNCLASSPREISSSSFASIGWPAVSHLLAVIEDLEERGVHFRSIRDPIDTSTPQGMFSSKFSARSPNSSGR